MKKLIALIAIGWLLLLPPLFTRGSCTQEFDAENMRIEADRPKVGSSTKAIAYWNERGILPRSMSVDQCRRAKPRDLARCGSGPMVQATIPVKDMVCRVYRDDEIRVRFFYDEHDRLERLAVDMKPFYSLPLPGGITIHWAR